MATSIHEEDVTEARERAVAVGRATLRDVAVDRDRVDRDRDVIIRYAITELDTLAEV